MKNNKYFNARTVMKWVLIDSHNSDEKADPRIRSIRPA